MTSAMWASKSPSVLGLVTMIPAICSAPCASMASRTISGVRIPPVPPVLRATVEKPLIAHDAGLVPWAVSGIKTFVRAVSPRSRW